ncbi:MULTISPECIES: response regulator transcription factor [Dehalobacter]|jgi:two-component system NarL family response regulator|uniref:Stage 0 sporulation protein A homolog n=2 Tax=Dehalobacter restrictus TaxID=55583 RepID=A0A857DJ37_9FIRM|nr:MULTISPECIES: response regulator transcription factor [Dehalobacter]AFV01599.1 DNA-binding response regulator DegU [Dehalobacter sp. DCA]AFV04634.1 DNA-binding response regulator DegU [Dehalobacter sp. CF]AHF09898.1 chemotaxis protein CheY [Dehalobacter restrictus DSM 9455]EQB21989.1 DNA-binding protein response regulator DegU [Dehalobacter sp. UNSWDHB]MCG1026190.1 response regulator transcription factor [Dehalobacter sp.]
MIRVVIADDHPLLREGLRRILEFEEGIQVVSEVGDGQGAINMARKTPFDVLLMDLNMPGVNGLEACKVIRREFPNIGILILTVDDSDEKVFQVLQLGVAGYLLKDVIPKALVDSIRKVYAGEPILSPSVTGKLLGQLSNPNSPKDHFGLSNREMEILTYVVKGSSNKDIGLTLFISEKTVKNHLSSIFRKLEVEDRTQAALKAVKTKLITLE